MKSSHYVAGEGGSIYAVIDDVMAPDGIKTVMHYVFNIPNPFTAQAPYRGEFPHSEAVPALYDKKQLHRRLMELLDQEVNRFASIVNAV